MNAQFYIQLFLIILIWSSSQSFFFAQAVLNPLIKPIISFCGGETHACAVFDNFITKCWGKGDAIGTLTDYGKSPSTVGDNIPYFDTGNNLNNTIQVSCSGGGFCVLLSSGRIKCVGLNDFGQVGIGTVISPIGAKSGHIGSSLPAVELGNNVFVSSVVAASTHVCILTTLKNVKCFGNNEKGQLGLGDNTIRGRSNALMGHSLPFVDLGDNIEVQSLHASSSSFHTCVILSAPLSAAQKIKCWGLNTHYQLGYGVVLPEFVGVSPAHMGNYLPLVNLGTESRVKQLAVGGHFTCAILIDNGLKCFGQGSDGELASGSTSSISAIGNSLPYVLIDSGARLSGVTAGGYHTCIIYDDMITVKCVGYNPFGQLGQGISSNLGGGASTRLPWIQAIQLGTGSLKIASIHCGSYFTCVVFVNHSVKCFGDNIYGQLAIGSAIDIGDGPHEMGSDLQFSELFSPTRSPTQKPTKAPTLAPIKTPSKTPTISPTTSPTKVPTRKCNYENPTLCKSNPTCIWQKVEGAKKCVEFYCKELNKVNCKKEKKRCGWDKGADVCISKI